MLHGRLSLMLGAGLTPLTPSHQQGEGRPPALQASRAKRATIALEQARLAWRADRGPLPHLRNRSYLGRCARRNERIWRTASGTRSFGSFHGNMLTSAFGASIAVSIATS